MGCGWYDLQGLHKILPGEDWFADDDGNGKRRAHGEDLDESRNQEGTKEGAGSEKECHIHSNAEQMCRYVHNRGALFAQ